MINFKNKKGLGRGLSSLIGEGKVSSNTKASISDLTRNKYQPRKKFDETSLNELSAVSYTHLTLPTMELV